MKKVSLLLLISLVSLMAFGQSSHGVSLSWQPSPDAAQNPSLTYNVYRGSGACPASGVPASMAKIASVPSPAYNDTAVTVGQSYCYVVTATLNGGESADSNTAGGQIPIAPPSGLTVTVK